MDAAAYLKKQGWRGTGHSLDQSDRGIVKPLQISKKIDALGVGVKKYAAVSDQWWLRAYDQGLKDFGTGKESALATAQKHGVNRGGLYARFVRGEEIPGTIGQKADSTVITSLQVSKKRLKEQGSISSKRAKHSDIDTPQIISDSDQQSKSLKHQIRAYIFEATRRGLLPADTACTTQRSQSPSEEDMNAVLKLAKMQKYVRKSYASPLEERKKLIRSLKRAALKYHEAQLGLDSG